MFLLQFLLHTLASTDAECGGEFHTGGYSFSCVDECTTTLRPGFPNKPAHNCHVVVDGSEQSLCTDVALRDMHIDPSGYHGDHNFRKYSHELITALLQESHRTTNVSRTCLACPHINGDDASGVPVPEFSIWCSTWCEPFP